MNKDLNLTEIIKMIHDELINIDNSLALFIIKFIDSFVNLCDDIYQKYPEQNHTMILAIYTKNVMQKFASLIYSYYIATIVCKHENENELYLQALNKVDNFITLLEYNFPVTMNELSKDVINELKSNKSLIINNIIKINKKKKTNDTTH